MSTPTTYARIALFIVGVNAFGMALAPVLKPSWSQWAEVLPDGALAEFQWSDIAARHYRR